MSLLSYLFSWIIPAVLPSFPHYSSSASVNAIQSAADVEAASENEHAPDHDESERTSQKSAPSTPKLENNVLATGVFANANAHPIFPGALATQQAPLIHGFENRGRPDVQIPDIISQNIERIFKGEEVVISHAGSSQYAQCGSSACGLAALNCAKVVAVRERDGVQGTVVLAELMTEKAVTDIVSIRGLWKGESHLEIEEIYMLPFFSKFLELQEKYFGPPGEEEFEKILTQIPDQIATLVITRAPEIIACMKIPTQRGDVFMIFNSHARPEHPDGAGLTFSTSIAATAKRLTSLLSVEEEATSDDTDWQSQLLSTYSAHLFHAPEQSISIDNNTVILDLSVELIQLRRSLSEAVGLTKSQNDKYEQLLNKLEEQQRLHHDAFSEQVRKSENLLQANKRLLSDVQSRRKSYDSTLAEHVDKIKGFETEQARLREVERQAKRDAEMISAQASRISSLESLNKRLVAETQAREHGAQSAISGQVSIIRQLEAERHRLLQVEEQAKQDAQTVTTQSSKIAELEESLSAAVSETKSRDKTAQSTINEHATKIRKLEAERERLLEAEKQGKRDAQVVAAQATKITTLESNMKRAASESQARDQASQATIAEHLMKIRNLEAERARLLDVERQARRDAETVAQQNSKIINLEALSKRIVADWTIREENLKEDFQASIAQLEGERDQWVEIEKQAKKDAEMLSSQGSKIASLEVLNKRLISDSQTRDQAAQNIIATKDAKIAELTSDTQVLLSEIDALNHASTDAMTAQQNKITFLEEELSRLIADEEAREQRMEDAVAKHNEQVAELEAQRSALLEQVDTLKQSQRQSSLNVSSRVKQLGAEAQALRDEISRLQSVHKDDLAAQTIRYQSLEAELKRQVDEAISRHEIAQHTLGTQTTKINSLEQDNRRLLAEAAGQINQINMHISEKQRLQAEALSLGSKVDGLATDNQRLHAEAKLNESKVEALAADNNRLQSEVDSRSTKVNNLTTEAQRLQTELKTKVSRTMTLDSETQRLQNELKLRNTKMESVMIENQRLQAEMKDHAAKIESLTIELQRARTDTENRTRNQLSSTVNNVLLESQRRLAEIRARRRGQ